MITSTNSGFELAIWESQIADHFKQFFMKFVNQNRPVRISVLLRKPQRSCLDFKLENLLISYSKKCETVHYFLAFGLHFDSKSLMGEFTTLAHTS